MPKPLKIISFQIVEHKQIGLADVFIFPEGSLSMEQVSNPESFYILDDQGASVHKVFSIVNKEYVLHNQLFEDKENFCYFIGKDNLEISDYYHIINKFIAEVCDFVVKDYTIYFKINPY